MAAYREEIRLKNHRIKHRLSSRHSETTHKLEQFLDSYTHTRTQHRNAGIPVFPDAILLQH